MISLPTDGSHSPNLRARELLGDADPVHVGADNNEPEDDVEHPVEYHVVVSLDATQRQRGVLVYDQAADEVGNEQVCNCHNIEKVGSWQWFTRDGIA